MPRGFDKIAVQRRVTERLIQIEGEPITLRRKPALQMSLSGGLASATDDYTPQRPRRRFFSGLNSAGRSVTAARFDVDAEGEGWRVRGVLIGPPNDDIQKDDLFTWNGQDMRVAAVHPDRRWQTKAEVVAYSG